jgi:hypothetical protein
LSFWSVLKLYWHRLWEWFFKAASLRCPRCQFANPLNATTCGKCQAQLTVELATEQVLHPPRQRWLKFKREATPGTKRRIQWAYLVSSAALLWWLLAYVEDHGGHLWPLYMALSVVYVAVILFLMFWLVPRQVFLSVSRRATRLVKLALALNGFALMILMQLFIKEWWVRTLTLAGLFVVLWLGFRNFTSSSCGRRRRRSRSFWGINQTPWTPPRPKDEPHALTDECRTNQSINLEFIHRQRIGPSAGRRTVLLESVYHRRKGRGEGGPLRGDAAPPLGGRVR